jgi:hypothetical protein
LEALHTNRSVTISSPAILKKLKEFHGKPTCCVTKKTLQDFFCSTVCHVPIAPILPLLNNAGQPNLKELGLDQCCNNSNGLLLFQDPESTQLFVDNVLVSPSTAIKKLYLSSCGLSLENQPLMAGFHKNTTIVEMMSYRDALQSVFSSTPFCGATATCTMFIACWEQGRRPQFCRLPEPMVLGIVKLRRIPFRRHATLYGRPSWPGSD